MRRAWRGLHFFKAQTNKTISSRSRRRRRRRVRQKRKKAMAAMKTGEKDCPIMMNWMQKKVSVRRENKMGLVEKRAW